MLIKKKVVRRVGHNIAKNQPNLKCSNKHLL